MTKTTLYISEQAHHNCAPNPDFWAYEARAWDNPECAESEDSEVYIIEWAITNPNADVEDECCDWEVFDVYGEYPRRYLGNQDDFTLIHL